MTWPLKAVPVVGSTSTCTSTSVGRTSAGRRYALTLGEPALALGAVAWAFFVPFVTAFFVPFFRTAFVAFFRCAKRVSLPWQMAP